MVAKKKGGTIQAQSTECLIVKANVCSAEGGKGMKEKKISDSTGMAHVTVCVS